MTVNNSINNTLVSPFILGATAVTSTGTQLNYLNGLSAVPINKIVTQTFTSSGTYTHTSGCQFAFIQVIGGGGGGGGAVGATSSAAGGGGSGGYCAKLVTVAQIGSTANVSVPSPASGGVAGNNNGNPGSNCSVNLTGSGLIALTANGGSGGNGSGNLSASGVGGVGGNGGTASGGDINITGDPGLAGIAFITGNCVGGNGGNSVWGGAGKGGGASAGGSASANSGSGGGGAAGPSGGVAGGNAGSGIVYIIEYCSS